jgi:pentatricopeptide repeat protein
MGDIFLRQGLWDKAREVFNRMLERDPENPEIRSRLDEVDRRATLEAAGSPVTQDAGPQVIVPIQELAPDQPEGVPVEDLAPDAVPMESLAPDLIVPIQDLAPDLEPEAVAVEDLAPDPEPEAVAVEDLAPHSEPEAVTIGELAPDLEPEAFDDSGLEGMGDDLVSTADEMISHGAQSLSVASMAPEDIVPLGAMPHPDSPPPADTPPDLVIPVEELAPDLIVPIQDLAPDPEDRQDVLDPAPVVPIGELAPDIILPIEALAPDSPGGPSDDSPPEDPTMEAFESWLNNLE